MFPKRTTFIVGAGASSEVGLPTGSQLVNSLETKLAFRFEHGTTQKGGDRDLFLALRRAFPTDVNKYVQAARRIRNALPLFSSIDHYLHVHQEDAEATFCAKLAIYQTILEAEKGSSLFFEEDRIDSTIQFDSRRNIWLAHFFRLLSEDIKKPDVNTIFKNVSIVTFNYDRCIEHYLVQALKQSYGISYLEAESIVANHLKLIHVYGKVGEYFGSKRVKFGDHEIRDAFQAEVNLRTHHEQLTNDEVLEPAREAISSASVLVFLGTAFNRSDLQILQPRRTHDRSPNSSKMIFSTRFGISDIDMEVNQRAMKDLFEASNMDIPTYYEETCTKLFTTCAKALTQ
jgi:hypothetical protein